MPVLPNPRGKNYLTEYYYTLRDVLRQAGYRFGRTRSWCPTGKARRKRKSGIVEVIDPDAAAKKN